MPAPITPPITPPITLPAVEAKTFDEWFFSQFNCTNLHDPNLATLSFVRTPRNSTTKEMLHSHAEHISMPFWPLVTPDSPDFNPEAAAAMAAVLNVLPTLQP